MMDRLEILEKKVQLAAQQLSALKAERQKLLAEVTFLAEENKRAKEILRENSQLRDEKKTISGRIEKILKKLNTLKI